MLIDVARHLIECALEFAEPLCPAILDKADRFNYFLRPARDRQRVLRARCLDTLGCKYYAHKTRTYSTEQSILLQEFPCTPPAAQRCTTCSGRYCVSVPTLWINFPTIHKHTTPPANGDGVDYTTTQTRSVSRAHYHIIDRRGTRPGVCTCVRLFCVYIVANLLISTLCGHNYKTNLW